jgi:hypothetical protein
LKVAWDWSNRNGWIPNFGWTNKLRDILGIKKSAVEKMEKISTASDEVPSIATMLAETMVAIMLEIKEDVKKILSYAELMSLCKPLMMGNNEEKKAADKLVSSIMKQLHALPEKERVEWQNQARLYKEN